MSAEMDALLQEIDRAQHEGLLSGDSQANIYNWLTRESVKSYRSRLVELIEAGDWSTLNELFWTSIPFGTGGRRGPMGEMGPATINDRTIAESAHGMAVYLRSAGCPHDGSAVIAHDTRNNSAHFARITACTLAAHGLHVYLFESYRSTPELSYSVRRFGCNIGVMITASHNPPADNGFKAYWASGGQIIAPHDAGIIAEVASADVIPSVEFDEAVASGLITFVGEDLDNEYIECVARLSESSNREISAIFTPLHGVAETSVYQVLQLLGFKQVDIFEPHRSPDGNFPNVPKHLPNPESLEVFDPVIKWVKETGHNAELILASDPDADRLGVMMRNSAGEFVSLSGNQVGALITDYLFRKRHESGRFSPDDYVVETLVTTPLTRAVAESHGGRAFHELLVGFKYIAQTMEEQGTRHFVFGTEESIGFLAGDYCRDKDAAICAMYILELAAELKAAGRNLLDKLAELHERCGYHCESQTSIYCEGPSGKAKIDGLMRLLREQPPASFGSARFFEVSDYLVGHRISVPANEVTGTIEKPQGDLLIFKSDPRNPVRVQIAVRPSGTEPKIKFYLFCQSDPGPGTSLSQARGVGDSLLNEVRQSLGRWAAEQLELL